MGKEELLSLAVGGLIGYFVVSHFLIAGRPA